MLGVKELGSLLLALLQRGRVGFVNVTVVGLVRVKLVLWQQIAELWWARGGRHDS
jgi:hypothetical protein